MKFIFVNDGHVCLKERFKLMTKQIKYSTFRTRLSTVELSEQNAMNSKPRTHFSSPGPRRSSVQARNTHELFSRLRPWMLIRQHTTGNLFLVDDMRDNRQSHRLGPNQFHYDILRAVLIFLTTEITQTARLHQPTSNNNQIILLFVSNLFFSMLTIIPILFLTNNTFPSMLKMFIPVRY